MPKSAISPPTMVYCRILDYGAFQAIIIPFKMIIIVRHVPTHVRLRGGILRAPSKAHPGPESSFPVTAPAEAHPDVQSSLRHGVLWTRINAWQDF